MINAQLYNLARLKPRPEGESLDPYEGRDLDSGLETIAEAIPQMVWIVDPQGYTEYVNRRWTEFTGMDLATTQEKGWTTAIHPEDIAIAQNSRIRPRSLGEPLECELRYRNAATGDYAYHLVRAVPTKNPSGQIVRWVGTSTDIDEHKRLLQELQDTVASRDEFLSIASHELQTPLTSLSLQLQMMIQFVDQNLDKATLMRNLETCERQSEKVISLLDELLDLTRIRSGQLNFALQEFDLVDAAQDVLRRIQPEIRRSGSNVTTDFETPLRGCWDPIRIEQVITNLLSNALKYGQGKPVRFRIRRRENGDGAIIQVSDQGMGISTEMQQRVFERFERAEPGRGASGLGLGLYIVRQIVKAHGGTIALTSWPNQGATFTVELPS